jgi:lipoprotein-releasing system permease protein
MGLRVGGSITLIAPKGNVTPFGTTPRIKTYKVSGTFRVGMTQYDTSFIFMPLSEAQLFFNSEGGVTSIEVMVTDPDNDLAMLPALQQVLDRDNRLVPWQETNSSFFEALQVERNVMFLILTLIILVAALNIVSGLIMLVKDKSGDIAVLRTMGASRGAVMRVFLIAGASIGVVGTLLGFIIGVVFCANIETIRQGLSRLTGTTSIPPFIFSPRCLPSSMRAKSPPWW